MLLAHKLLAVVISGITLRQNGRIFCSASTSTRKDVDGVSPTDELAEEVVKKDEETLRRLDQTGPYVYSKMATIMPDPLLEHNSEEVKQELQEKFGRWHFWDGDEGERPSDKDYCAEYKYRDVPGEYFPEGAWQEDAVFVNHILNDGSKLVSRATEAIFTDMGRGKPLPPEGYAQRAEMFRFDQVDLATQTEPLEDYVPRKGQRKRGGWSTAASHEGLVRRLLHAMMTNDEFVVVIGGDAAAAGHGNHFQQSSSMVFHRMLAPVLARMGVKLTTRNMAMGHGMGTFQSSLGFSSLYGTDIDLLIWDGSQTESGIRSADLFFRQGLLSSGKQGKIPVLLMGGNTNVPGTFELLKWLHEEAGAHVGQMGTAMHSIPETQSAEQALELPDPFRYVVCSSEAHALCNEQLHCTQCWIARDDMSNPWKLFANLDYHPSNSRNANRNTTTAASGEATRRWWYPGWRQHLLAGRNLAYYVLDAMDDGIEAWSSGTMGGPPLDDDEWHVGPMYDDEMRPKLTAALADESQACYEFVQNELGLPGRLCRTRMQGATQHTPRPAETTLTDLVVAGESQGWAPVNTKSVLYEGPDVHNTCLDANGAVDVVQVVSQRRLQGGSKESANNLDVDYMPPVFRQAHEARMAHKEEQQHLEPSAVQTRVLGEDISLGKGWAVRKEKPGQCDGEYLSICGRDATDTCPLLGYHDSLGEIVGDSSSGWMVLDVPNVKEGLIFLKYAFYSTGSVGETANRNLRQQRRTKKEMTLPDGVALEFVVGDGEVTTWSKEQILEQSNLHNKKMALATLLDQPDFTSEASTVRLAFRVKGCDKPACLFGFSHVYWA